MFSNSSGLLPTFLHLKIILLFLITFSKYWHEALVTFPQSDNINTICWLPPTRNTTQERSQEEDGVAGRRSVLIMWLHKSDIQTWICKIQLHNCSIAQLHTRIVSKLEINLSFSTKPVGDGYQIWHSRELTIVTFCRLYLQVTVRYAVTSISIRVAKSISGQDHSGKMACPGRQLEILLISPLIRVGNVPNLKM